LKKSPPYYQTQGQRPGIYSAYVLSILLYTSDTWCTGAHTTTTKTTSAHFTWDASAASLASHGCMMPLTPPFCLSLGSMTLSPVWGKDVYAGLATYIIQSKGAQPLRLCRPHYVYFCELRPPVSPNVWLFCNASASTHWA